MPAFPRRPRRPKTKRGVLGAGGSIYRPPLRGLGQGESTPASRRLATPHKGRKLRVRCSVPCRFSAHLELLQLGTRMTADQSPPRWQERVLVFIRGSFDCFSVCGTELSGSRQSGCSSYSVLAGRPQTSHGLRYCELKRKNRLPDCAVLIVAKLLVPSLEIPPLSIQLARSGLCCKFKPVKEAGQEMVRPPAEGVTVNAGVAGGADEIGLASRPRKSTLPVWVSRIRKMNG